MKKHVQLAAFDSSTMVVSSDLAAALDGTPVTHLLVSVRRQMCRGLLSGRLRTAPQRSVAWSARHDSPSGSGSSHSVMYLTLSSAAAR
jgi:hypothetical protein